MISSPTSRPEYGLYESPPKTSGSQTHGLITDTELHKSGPYSPLSKPGARSRSSRKALLGTVAVVVGVIGVGGIISSGTSDGTPPIPEQPNAMKNPGDGNEKQYSTLRPPLPETPAPGPALAPAMAQPRSKPEGFWPYQRYSPEEDNFREKFDKPKVAWLMSFPNSGTSYTLRLAQWASNVTAATNYGDECDVDDEGRNTPLYPEMDNSPALKYPDKYSLPERYALTKTHCGGRCTHCAPDKYVETQLTFHQQCLQGNRLVPLNSNSTASGQNIKKNGKSERVLEVRYPEELVARAVHVIRDPFNNAVARFHLDWGKYNHKAMNGDKESKKFVDKYAYNPDGFRKWCKSIDDVFIKDEEKSRFMTEEILELFRKIPCHGDFFRYIQWHNLAVATVAKMKVPTYILHYENYATDFERTKDELMSFLQLDIVGSIPEFIPGKSYRSYFSAEERVAVLDLMRMLANPETMDLIDRYDYEGDGSSKK